MSMQFNGSLSALQAVVAQLNIPCHWEHKGVFEMAVFDDGVSNLKLNWWPQSGELRLVGDPEVRHTVEASLSALLARAEGGAV